MYYLIREATFQSPKPEFMTGGMGIDTESDNHRYVTSEFEKALKFETIKEAKKVLTRQFVLVELGPDNFFKRVD